MKRPTFENKLDLFVWLKANKSDLLEFKKNTLKFSDVLAIDYSNETTKALFTDNKDDVTTGVIKRTIVGNTYNYLDSHDDVHVGSTFGKSISERANKVFHLHDHKHEVSAKVGKFSTIYEKELAWRDLGINKDGNTIALMADSEISRKMNEGVFLQYLDGDIDQHSVGMRYVKVDLAINDEQYPEEKAIWDKYIDSIGNAEKAKAQGYFYAVSEAKLIEISAVLMGSNDLTPTVQNIEPSKDTQKTDQSEPPQSTQIDWSQVIEKVKI
jgi:hypothetical protein